jgi:DtxR family Mn-dependent transcriptional regulator
LTGVCNFLDVPDSTVLRIEIHPGDYPCEKGFPVTVGPTVQRYLAEIYRLETEHDAVTMPMVADILEISVQAVSRMIRQLVEDGWLEHEPYRGVHLTAAGQQVALQAIRRHRIVEVFFVKIMQFGWDAVHDIIEPLEGGINDIVLERMAELTGNPARCPHGEPIPSKDGVMPHIDDIPLSQVPAGTASQVSRVRTHDPEKLRYLAELGMVPGAPITVIGHGRFDGPVRVQLGDQEQLLGFELAKQILILTTA